MYKVESLINCNTCRIKKLKCSRELPTCSYCSKRDMQCAYSDQIKRRGVSTAGIISFINKLKVGFSAQSCKLTSRDGEKNKAQASKFILYKPIPQPISFVDEDSQIEITKIQFNNTQKFQTHILLMLSTQIIEYDGKLIPQIDFFINKLELGVYGGLLKFSIHMDQQWITELFSPSFEEKCITSYFQTFHPILTYLSKYKFYTDFNSICPVLKSIIILFGYSSISKQSPELLKYLKHLAIVQLKKNMFNVKLTICQAMFIFSYYLLYQGLGKQSLEYFHQAYLMASALGIHKDIPGLSEMDKDERRCIRFTSYNHDSHLSSVISIQPYYLYLAPIWKPLNPIYQTNPHSNDPNEFLMAECNCLSLKCFNNYWIRSTNLMIKYCQLAINNSVAFLENYTNAIFILETLLNYSLIRTLDLYLILSRKCKNSEELQIVKNYAKMYVGFYHGLIIVLNCQFSPENPTLELDQNTKKQIYSAEALYRITTDVNPLSLVLLYYNLCFVSLLYIKLILIYNRVPQVKEFLIEKFKQVYRLFSSYKSKYNLPVNMIEVVEIIANYYKIKV